MTRRAIGMLFVLMTFFSLLAGCARPPTPFSLPEPEPRPGFINGTSPEASCLISQEVYDAAYGRVAGMREAEDGFASSICVDFSLTPLVQRGDDLTEDDRIFDRVTLLVDDTVLTGGPDSIMDGLNLSFQGEIGNPHTQWSGPFAACWVVPLETGPHKVSFEFRQTSGDIARYTWYFGIVDD